jgi:hypothetical protein
MSKKRTTEILWQMLGILPKNLVKKTRKTLVFEAMLTHLIIQEAKGSQRL